jgi:hypothetical protein
MKDIVKSVGAGLVIGASIAGFIGGVGIGWRAMIRAVDAVNHKLDQIQPGWIPSSKS